LNLKNRKTRIGALQNAGIKISKIHLSSALKTKATKEAREALKNFADDVYLHQVIARGADGKLKFSAIYPTRSPLKTRHPQSAVRNWKNGAFIFTFRCTRRRAAV
jgi:hypothetical protein